MRWLRWLQIWDTNTPLVLVPVSLSVCYVFYVVSSRYMVARCDARHGAAAWWWWVFQHPRASPGSFWQTWQFNIFVLRFESNESRATAAAYLIRSHRWLAQSLMWGDNSRSEYWRDKLCRRPARLVLFFIFKFQTVSTFAEKTHSSLWTNSSSS